VSLAAWGAEARAALGDFEAALKSAHDALHMAVEIKHPSSVSIADAFLGYVHLMRGDVQRAVPILEQGLSIATEHGLVHSICASAIYLAWAHALEGSHTRALAYLAQALERPPGALLPWTRFRTVTASVYLEAGQPDVAAQEIERGMTAAAERGATGYRAPLLRLHAEVLSITGETTFARDRGNEALSIALELGHRPEIAHCHAALGRLAARSGDAASAAEHRASARRFFHELTMPFWSLRE
jgi:ATP/maltotriose-dependent transcriptional regulator MalT